MNKLYILLLLLPAYGFTQPALVPLHAPAYHIADRMLIRNAATTPLHSEIKGYSRRDLAQFVYDSTRLSALDRTDIQYLMLDNNEWVDSAQVVHSRRPILKYFYRTPANLFEVNTKYFQLRINPMLNFHIGQDMENEQKWVFYNQRGVEARAQIDKRVYVYSSFLETQAAFPQYINQEWTPPRQTTPGVGFYKNYESSVLNIKNGVDYNLATAYIGVNATKHIGVQFGHGQHFIGDGYRSMMLSDFAPPGLFLKINTRIWRFHYQNLFMELSPVAKQQVQGDQLLPKKYVVAHYLNFNVTSKLAIGLYETTVLNRSRQFELQYLNPVIIYRTVEGAIGSKDNVLLGLTGRWNLFNRFQLYGQFILDEFKISEVRAQNGWWANKYGAQVGLKYINVLGIDHLDMQVEYNAARPYTYSHTDSLNSYTHYNHPLAHPLGANFKEVVGILKYQPTARLFLSARLIQMRTGEDPYNKNFGTNILLSNLSREMENGNTIGQGIATNIRIVGVDASWMFRHNMYFDMRFLVRKKVSDVPERSSNTQIFSAGLRMNLWQQNLDF